MSNFLEELTSSMENCWREDDWADNTDEVSVAMDLVDSLDENARRMLEIGIVQDKLIELGFELDGISRVYLMLNKPLVIKESHIIGLEIYFNEMGALLKATSEVFSFASPNWQEDLINRVKELIK